MRKLAIWNNQLGHFVEFEVPDEATDAEEVAAGQAAAQAAIEAKNAH